MVMEEVIEPNVQAIWIVEYWGDMQVRTGLSSTYTVRLSQKDNSAGNGIRRNRHNMPVRKDFDVVVSLSNRAKPTENRCA